MAVSAEAIASSVLFDSLWSVLYLRNIGHSGKLIWIGSARKT